MKYNNMKADYIKNNYKFQLLSREHVLNDFECSSKDLNEYLKNDALVQQELYLNSTNLIMCDDKIIGFVSILTDTFKIGNIKDQELRERIKKQLNLRGNTNTIPAVKIGRFAIDKKYAGKGLGGHILKNVLLNLINVTETVGFRYITIDAYASAFGFYVNKYGFEYHRTDEKNVKKIEDIIKKDPERRFGLYMDIEKIKDLEKNS